MYLCFVTFLELLQTISTNSIIQRDQKSLCTWWLQYNNAKIEHFKQNTFGMWTVLYRTRSARTQECQQMSGDWRGTLWTLLVTFCIVIIRCTQTFWSLCTIFLLALFNLRQKLNVYHHFMLKHFYTNFLYSCYNSMLPGTHQTRLNTPK